MHLSPTRTSGEFDPASEPPDPASEMGGGQSAHHRVGHGVNRSNGVDSVGPIRPAKSGAGPRRPIPDPEELERRFNEVLIQMDLPPERAKHLRGFDAPKKWDIICDQEQVHAREPPSAYLSKIRTYLDPSASRSAKKIRSLGDSTSTQVLRNLEISLRTNNIEWVREFLGEQNQGLDVLVQYLSERLLVMRHTMAQGRRRKKGRKGSPKNDTIKLCNLTFRSVI